MKRRLLLTIVMALAVGVGACGDDETPAGNNGGDDTGITDSGTDAGGTDADDETDGGTDAGDTGGTDADDDDAGDTSSATGLIVAEDQLLAASASQTVTIASATSEGAGWAVIHEGDGEGNVGAIIGQTALTDGENTDITVDVGRNITHGETLYAMLHTDLGTAGSWEPDTDVPVTDENDLNVVDTFVVSVPTVVGAYDPAASLDDLSTVVTLNTVVAEEDAFVVIHENDCADFGDVIGHAAVTSGENNDVEVTLDRPAVDGETLCGMLHFDTGTAGEYEFDGTTGSEDAPVLLADDSVVMGSFDVSVTEGIPAIRITIGATGSQDYEFQSVEPAKYDDGLSGSSDPVLYLNDGWRYEIVNNATTTHPFELTDADGGLGGNGEVMLSQAASPTTETDPDTKWVEDGDSVLFTVAGDAFAGGALSSSVDTYRCASHPDSMTNDVIVQ